MPAFAGMTEVEGPVQNFPVSRGEGRALRSGPEQPNADDRYPRIGGASSQKEMNRRRSWKIGGHLVSLRIVLLLGALLGLQLTANPARAEYVFGRLTCEGKDAEGHCTGKVTMAVDNGDQIVGRYEPGKVYFSGRSSYISKNYTTVCEDTNPFGLCVGKAVATWKNGTVYEGRKRAATDGGYSDIDVWTGPIKITSPDGTIDRCTKSARDGKCLGSVVRRNSDGTELRGAMVGGSFVPEGSAPQEETTAQSGNPLVSKDKNGTTITCEAKDKSGNCVGTVTFEFDNGDKLIGQYSRGKPYLSGQSTYITKNTTGVCEDTDATGRCKGKFVSTNSAGTIYEGQKKMLPNGNDVWTGPLTIKYADGARTECSIAGDGAYCLGDVVDISADGSGLRGHVELSDNKRIWSGPLFFGDTKGNVKICESSTKKGECGEGHVRFLRADGTERTLTAAIVDGQMEFIDGAFIKYPNGDTLICPNVNAAGSCVDKGLLEKADGTLVEQEFKN